MVDSIQYELTLYRLGYLLKLFITFVVPIVALIVIIKCSSDIFKVVVHPEEANNSTKKAISRLIISIILILLPYTIKNTFEILLDLNDKLVIKYYKDSSPEKIKELEKELEEAHLLEEKRKQQEAENLNDIIYSKQPKNSKGSGGSSNKNNSGNSNNQQNNKSNGSSNNGQNPVVDENFKTTALDAQTLLNQIPKNNVSTTQVSVFASGKLLSSANYNTNNSVRYPVSSASKAMLGIIAAKMQEENIINLDTKIDTYWHQLYYRDLNNSTSAWQSYIGSASTVKNYTTPDTYLVENPATLRNCLTHSSTIKNMSMVHMVPNDPSSEYFGGGMSKTYGRAAFMLKHTSHQLFEQGAIPGTTTSYNMASDNTTRDHALAGFTMQIAMNQTLNEYLTAKITSQVGSSSNPGFTEGNSIYFASAYYSSADDLAKIISAIANNGYYDGKQIFGENAINEIEKVYSNLNNQTIAFDYNGNKYVKYGSFSSLSTINNYGIGNDISKNATYISYDPQTSIGFVVNIQYNNSQDRANSLNTLNNVSNYFYSNS